jgi:glyoxylase I family protein
VLVIFIREVYLIARVTVKPIVPLFVDSYELDLASTFSTMPLRASTWSASPMLDGWHRFSLLRTSQCNVLLTLEESFSGRRIPRCWLDSTRIILESKLTPESYDEEPWYHEAGATVFAPFAKDTDYFGRAEQQWMINLRVRDLDPMMEQLRAANINVSMDPEQYPNRRFARLHDPEGNPIELWQPK